MAKFGHDVAETINNIQLTSNWYKLNVSFWYFHDGGKCHHYDMPTHKFIGWAKRHPTCRFMICEFAGNTHFGKVYAD